jgi:hypothetical protein
MSLNIGRVLGLKICDDDVVDILSCLCKVFDVNSCMKLNVIATYSVRLAYICNIKYKLLAREMFGDRLLYFAY